MFFLITKKKNMGQGGDSHDSPAPVNRGRLQRIPGMMMVAVVITMYCTYMFIHMDVIFSDPEQQVYGWVTVSVFNYLFLMVTINYVQATLTVPGYIPDTPEFMYSNRETHAKETKKTGERRHCKWCGK